ncbi:hypothetical protein B005_5139 [Nocardiopsis alba ATCC BAA-2165]|uniref:Uncharacterized protein n=1 Tax=Nocardiopsis alba (strain ATCC BAA-2165 / BE74) TaxID=1205910 RepID=J7L6A6_NOCAA|nr:hypothetical protein B005_5139 [Nocardiopsis alba ATCC BAA-2165]
MYESTLDGSGDVTSPAVRPRRRPVMAGDEDGTEASRATMPGFQGRENTDVRF